VIADVQGLDAALEGAQFCLTGEGAIDEQTLRGKTVCGVAAHARTHGVRVVAFAGSVLASAESTLAAQGVVCIPIVACPMTLAQAQAECAVLLERAATRAARLLS
jgi:glycerate kinase